MVFLTNAVGRGGNSFEVQAESSNDKPLTVAFPGSCQVGPMVIGSLQGSLLAGCRLIFKAPEPMGYDR